MKKYIVSVFLAFSLVSVQPLSATTSTIEELQSNIQYLLQLVANLQNQLQTLRGGTTPPTGTGGVTTQTPPAQPVETREQMVVSLYKTHLRRVPAQTETEYWVSSGFSRADIKASIVSSFEFQQKTLINNLYRSLLNRDTDSTEVNEWYTKISVDKWTLEQIRESIVKSNEYIDRSNNSLSVLYPSAGLVVTPSREKPTLLVQWKNPPGWEGNSAVNIDWCRVEETRTVCPEKGETNGVKGLLNSGFHNMSLLTSTGATSPGMYVLRIMANRSDRAESTYAFSGVFTVAQSTAVAQPAVGGYIVRRAWRPGHGVKATPGDRNVVLGSFDFFADPAEDIVLKGVVLQRDMTVGVPEDLEGMQVRIWRGNIEEVGTAIFIPNSRYDGYVTFTKPVVIPRGESETLVIRGDISPSALGHTIKIDYDGDKNGEGGNYAVGQRSGAVIAGRSSDIVGFGVQVVNAQLSLSLEDRWYTLSPYADLFRFTLQNKTYRDVPLSQLTFNIKKNPADISISNFYLYGDGEQLNPVGASISADGKLRIPLDSRVRPDGRIPNSVVSAASTRTFTLKTHTFIPPRWRECLEISLSAEGNEHLIAFIPGTQETQSRSACTVESTPRPSAPSISSVTPKEFGIGSFVVQGSSLDSSSMVYVADVKVTPSSIMADGTSLEFALPRSMYPDSYSLHVANSQGIKSNSVIFSVPWPSASSVSPSSGAEGSRVRLYGKNFHRNFFVLMTAHNGGGSVRIPHESIVVNEYEGYVSFTIPSGVAPGTYSLGFAAVDGRPSKGFGATFTVTAPEQVVPAPTISSLSEVAFEAGGNSITLFGSNLDSSTVVQLGETIALKPGYVVEAGSYLWFHVPSSVQPGSYSLYVTNRSGKVSNKIQVSVSASQQVVPAPTISSISPFEGKPGATVTVSGSNLGNNSTVHLGTTQVRLDSYEANGSALRFTIPSSVSAGSYTVSVADGSGQKSNGVTFTVIAPAPAPVDAGTTGSRRDQIKQLYLDLLKREADSEGLNFWDASGWSIDTIKASIMQGDEYQRLQASASHTKSLANILSALNDILAKYKALQR